jgi:hypothetical protein
VSFARSWGLSIGMFLALVVIAFAALSAEPRDAEAGCSTRSVCTRSGGRSSCRSSTVCTAPRVPRCTWVSRCTPQRSCVSRPGYSHCVTRDVCRRVQVCS